MRLKVKRFSSAVATMNPKRLAFLCHHNADPDAICSAFALARILSKSFKLHIAIASPGGASKLSRKVASSLGFDVESSLEVQKWSAFVLVDTNTLSQLREWGDMIRSSSKPVIVVDHHVPHPDTSDVTTVNICVEDVTSTCEVVLMIARRLGLEIDAVSAQALVTGLAYDTRHFTYSTSDTIKAAARLVARGGDVEKALDILRSRMERSERIARLKAGQRSEIRRIGKWVAVVSSLGSYQASAARALIGMGADLAVVGGNGNGESRISLRSTKEFHEETGIHLGRDLARPIGQMLGGRGGGHSTAAGMNAVKDPTIALNRIVETVSEKIERHR